MFHSPFPPGHTLSSHTHRIYYKRLKHSAIAAAAGGADCSINLCPLLRVIKDLIHGTTNPQRGEIENEVLQFQELPPPDRTVPSGVVSPAASVLQNHTQMAPFPLQQQKGQANPFYQLPFEGRWRSRI